MEVTITELRDNYPEQFQKEFYSWAEHTLDYRWWEFVYADFRTRCASLGIFVGDINFALEDYAAFAGSVDLGVFMEYVHIDKVYFALHEALAHAGYKVRIHLAGNRRVRSAVEGIAAYDFAGEPLGVFKGLDALEWEQFLDQQLDESELLTHLENTVEDLCHELLGSLEDEAEYLRSEESFLQCCADWMFEVADPEEEPV